PGGCRYEKGELRDDVGPRAGISRGTGDRPEGPASESHGRATRHRPAGRCDGGCASGGPPPCPTYGPTANVRIAGSPGPRPPAGPPPPGPGRAYWRDWRRRVGPGPMRPPPPRRNRAPPARGPQPAPRAVDGLRSRPGRVPAAP